MQYPELPQLPELGDKALLDQSLSNAPIYTTEAITRAQETIASALGALAMRPTERKMQEWVVEDLLGALAHLRDAVDIDIRTLSVWAAGAPLSLSRRAVSGFAAVPEATFRRSWLGAEGTEIGWASPQAGDHSKEPPEAEVEAEEKKPRYSVPRKRKSSKDSRAGELAWQEHIARKQSKGA